MGLDVTGIGAAADLIRTVVTRIWPDKSEEEKEQLVAAMQIVNGQLAINAAEAASPSIFVAGWRPAIGWVCGLACCWNWVGLSIFKFVASLYHYPISIAPADISEMMPVLLGMLGIGGLRTIEKINKVA
jgi:hypothetical protein